MILSHTYRFIFIKTFKTAGTSLELTLAPLCGPRDVVTPIRNHPTDDQVDLSSHQPRNYGDQFFNHMPAHAVRACVGEAIWEDYFTFAVERNPWDKALSFYSMEARRRGPLTLDQFLFTPGRHGENSPLYTDRSGTVIVDRVLRYEKMDRELAEVFTSLNVPWKGMTVRARSGNRTDRRPYQDVYTVSQRNQVAALFRQEIDLWGYSFDNPDPA